MRTLMRSECAVLPLVLKGKWYDMIASGEKREEYRDATPYWAVRLKNWDDDGRECVVEFRRGYAHDAPRMAFMSTWYWHWAGMARHKEWGEPDSQHYVIALGPRVKLLKGGGHAYPREVDEAAKNGGNQ